MTVPPVIEPTDSNNPNPDSAPDNNSPPDWALALARDTEHNRVVSENAQLRARLEQQVPIQQPPLPSLQPGDTFQDPNKFLDVLGQLVQRQIAPLQDELNQAKKERLYNQLKAKIKAANPGLVQIFGQLENAIDIEMQGKEPTEQNLINCIKQVVGHVALTNPQAFQPKTPTPPNNPTPPNSNNPPVPPVPNNSPRPAHLAPSPSRQIDADPNNQPIDMSQFDENERRLMREKGIGPRRWLAIKNMPVHGVTKEEWKRIQAIPD